MFPIRDSIRARRRPVATVLLILLNIVGFVLEMGAGPEIEAFVTRFAVVPDRLVAAARAGAWLPEVATVFTSMFLHADILHLAGNVWFLWIFGDNVEDRFGRVGFVAFYVACGVAAAFSQVAMDPTSAVPMVGASGAIAGVLGAYLRLYPGARVLAVVPIFLFLHFLEVRAIVFLGVWFAIQVGSSLLGVTGVAWWAHIAGFAAGLLLALFVPRRVTTARRPSPRVRRR
ncbi:MAG: rhomboid family intramembrane serine protease [Myxococcota bacterium]